MKNTRFILGIGLLALIGACKKPDTTSTPVSVFSTYSSINEVFDKLRLQPKYATVNAVTGGSFYGNSGTRYIFPPNCFQDAAGNTITGNVQIAVTEYLKKGDMVFSKMLPVSDGSSLISGGEINVNGSAGGVQVYIKPGMAFSAYVPQPGRAVAGMAYFSGLPAQDTAVSIVNWRRFDSIPGRAMIIIRDTFKSQKDTLAFICDSMKMINGDVYRVSGTSQTFSINISATGATISNSSDIRSFVFIDTVTSLTSLGYFPHTDKITNATFEKIPVHFVIFGLIDKKFYGGVYAATPANGSTYNINLTEVKPEDFKAQLNNLTK